MKTLLTPPRKYAFGLLCAALGMMTVTGLQAQMSVQLTPTEYHGGQFHVSENGATDGSISSAVSGGVEPYSYVWKRLEGAMGYTGMGTSQHLSDVGSGQYRLVVTDSIGTMDSASVFLSQPALLMVMPQVTHLTCANGANGSVTLMVSGGVAPYGYLWSNGDTLSSTGGLGAGQHHVTVTSAGGAQRTEYFHVNAPMAVMADIMQMTWAQCHGDTVVMAASAWGGTAPYTYHWSTGAFSSTIKTVQGGQYSVQVTDMHNCHATDSLWVTVPQGVNGTVNYLPYPNGTPFSCDTCNDGIIQVTPNGGMEPYSVMWSTGHMGLVLTGMYADSAYHVTVTDMMGCTWQSETINAPRGIAFEQQLGVFLMAHQYAGGHHVSHSGASDGMLEAVVVGGVPPYSMVWNTGDTVAELTGLAAGYYTVTVTDQSGTYRTRSKTLTAPMPLSVSMTGGLGGCMAMGSQLNAFVNGGAPPYTYAWHRNDSLYDSTHNYPYLYIHQEGVYRVRVADANADTVTTELTVNAIAPLVTTLTATEVQPGYHATCHGDTVQLNLTVSGGMVPYSYMWEHGSFQKNPKVTSGGWKVVRVHDMMGCTRVDSIYVHMPGKLLNKINPHVYANGQAFSCDTCNDGKFVLDSIWGGVGPYAHVWSDGSAGDTLHGIIPDTVYSITMTDALGCSVTESGSLPRTWNPEPPGLALMFDKSFYAGGYHVSCAGCMDGWIQLWPNGGTPPYSYQWNDGSSMQSRYGLMAGTYSVTVTDARGQSLWRDFTLLGPGGGFSVHINNSSTSCRGMVSGSLNAMVMGGVPPYTYQWQRDGMPLPEMWDRLKVWQAGTYRVTVTDMNGQTAQDSVQVGMGAELTVSATATEKYGNAHTGCTVADGELTLRLSGGTPPYNVNVNRSSMYRNTDTEDSYNHWFSTMDTVAVLDSLQAGNYHISVSGMNGGCYSNTDIELRSPGGYIVTTTPTELPNGQYASCDTCSDVTVDVAALGGWGAMQYAWVEIPAEHTPIRLRGASLSISERPEDLDASMFDGTDPSVFGTGAQQTGLKTETMYMVATMDELGCMGQAMFTVERPRAEQAIVPGWGLYGNDGSGNELAGEGEPWFGTGDSTDVVMKANGVPQLRLGANGVTTVEGQLRLAGLDDPEAEPFRIPTLNPAGELGGPLTFEEAAEQFAELLQPCKTGADGLPIPRWVSGPGKIVTDCNPVNVGIGTGTPLTKLDVRGKIYGHTLSVNTYATDALVTFKASAATNALEVQGEDGLPALQVQSNGITRVRSGQWLNEGDRASIEFGDFNAMITGIHSKGLSFSTWDAQDAMVIAHGGKVGIGVGTDHTFGEGLLEVNGTIRSTRIVVELEGWPDYVFAPNYALKPLKDVEKFIKESGHLPDVPSAAEIEMNGLDLGELVRIQMKKIEELTLYVIELEKRLGQSHTLPCKQID